MRIFVGIFLFGLIFGVRVSVSLIVSYKLMEITNEININEFYFWG